MIPSLNWVVSFKLFLGEKTLTFHRLPLKSETFKKSQLSELIDVPSGCYIIIGRSNNSSPLLINYTVCSVVTDKENSADLLN